MAFPKRAAARLALAFAVLVLLPAAVVLLVPLGTGRVQPLLGLIGARAAHQQHTRGPLFAGAGRAEVAVPPGGPIAGYPAYRRDIGGNGPLPARALALQAGKGQVVLASLPVLLISPGLEAEIVRRAGLPAATCLMVAATHTHSGPGGYWDNPLLELGGVGRFSAERQGALAEAAASAIRAAVQALRPAHLEVVQADWPQGPATPRAQHTIDPALTVLRASDAQGAPIATVVDYAMHPTVIPRASHRLSGDWPEAAAQELERGSGAPALVLQGAVGDATWTRAPGNAFDEPEVIAQRLGVEVAARALKLLAGAVPAWRAAPPASVADAPALVQAQVELGCTVRLLQLPEPDAGPGVPWLLRRAAGNALRLFADRAALQTTLELPGLRLVGVPGEPVGELGLRARAAAAVPLALVGLADGYAGYVETPERWRAGAGESARTWHGPGLAAALELEGGP